MNYEYFFSVQTNIRLIILLIFAINLLFQENLKSHNKANGGCESHCFKDNFIFEDSNSKRKKPIKFENIQNINSCINSNFCRG